MLAFAVSAADDVSMVRTAEAAVGRMTETDTHGAPWSSYRRAGRAAGCDTQLALRLAEGAEGSDVPGYQRSGAALTRALVAWQDGHTEAAHRFLEDALALVAPQRVRFFFVDNHDQPCRDSAAAAGSRDLTAREREVLTHLRTPMTSVEIAQALSMSVNTFKTHCKSIYRKLG